MKRILSIIAALAICTQPVLAGESNKALRQKLDQAKQEKISAMSTHQLEAELMKEVKRDNMSEKPVPAGRPAKLAAQK